MSADATPAHLAPENCYICGAKPHPDGDPAQDGHHFWSNSDAAADFAEQDRQNRSTYSPEVAYVAEHRPY